MRTGYRFEMKSINIGGELIGSRKLCSVVEAIVSRYEELEKCMQEFM